MSIHALLHTYVLLRHVRHNIIDSRILSNCVCACLCVLELTMQRWYHCIRTCKSRWLVDRWMKRRLPVIKQKRTMFHNIQTNGQECWSSNSKHDRGHIIWHTTYTAYHIQVIKRYTVVTISWLCKLFHSRLIAQNKLHAVRGKKLEYTMATWSMELP